MALKKTIPSTKSNAAVKRQAQQSDLKSGFATQILKSPRKNHSHQFSSRALEIDDAIELSSDEETPQAAGSSQVSQKRKSDLLSSLAARKRVKTTNVSLASIGKSMLSQGSLTSHANTGTQTEDSEQDLSWLDRYPPKKLADLAVHKKKVSDVQEWLQRSFKNVSQHTVLILTGAAGVGKTATIETLSAELDFDMIEWKNPMSTEWSDNYSSGDSDGLAQKFERFLSISDKYSALDFGESNRNMSEDRRKIIVVEDIPNTFSSSSANSNAKAAFQDSMIRYLSSPRNKYPLILIVTETEPRGEDRDWRRSDAMSTRNLLTRDILQARNCSQISFNDVAPTFLVKALTRIIDKLPRSQAVDISQAVLEEIAQNANGDIRSAVNTLEFISHKFRTNGRTPRARQKKKRGEILTLTKDEAQILNIVTNREAALGYFHAIGKVIYNKRLPASSNDPYDPLPPHLALEARHRPENTPSAILDETSTDVPTFLMGIHQNYIESCTTLTQCAGVMEALSGSACVSELTTGVVALSGVLQSLPENARRPHAAKVYFPVTAKLWRAQRRHEEAILNLTANAAREDDDEDRSTGRLADKLERLDWRCKIAVRRGERPHDRLRKLVQLTRNSTLGRGGLDAKDGVLDDDDADVDVDVDVDDARVESKPIDKDRPALWDDEIEEVE